MVGWRKGIRTSCFLREDALVYISDEKDKGTKRTNDEQRKKGINGTAIQLTTS